MFVAGTDELILSAKKKGNEFLISSYSDQHNQNHCAVLSWNSWRTEFFLRSRWCELCEPNATPFTCTTPPEEREMLAAILYERNYKGDCPKKFTVVIPKVSKQGQREVFCPRRKKNLVECFDSGDWGDIIPFTTKPPEWNEAKQRFEGGFTDRVKLASIRNFILQKAGKCELRVFMSLSALPIWVPPTNAVFHFFSDSLCLCAHSLQRSRGCSVASSASIDTRLTFKTQCRPFRRSRQLFPPSRRAPCTPNSTRPIYLTVTAYHKSEGTRCDCFAVGKL
jgi:hypothetical protein